MQGALVVWGIIVAITLICAFLLWLLIVTDANRQTKEYIKRHGQQ